ncbi:flippase [Haloterrigena salifodinae]|uniref:flippase n=1 Tax=Haloterrigena salifodinae TaxID=2675099 RepID=UPI000F88492C|nr:flippase [Haloterrigena salifodinae]
MPDAEDIETLLSSATLILIGTVLSSVSGLVERVIIGRVLGPSEYGTVSICLAIVTLAATTSMFGLTQGVPRYMSRFDSISKRRGVWASGMLIATLLSIVVTSSLFVFAEELSVILLDGTEYTTLLRIFLLTIPFLTALKMAVSGIRGEENTIYRTYSHDLLYPLARIGLLGILFLIGVGTVAPSIAYVMGALITAVVALYLLNKLFSLTGAINWRFRELVLFSAPLIVSMVMSILLTRTDTIMIGYFRTATEAGLYSAAYPIAAGLQLVLSSFGFLYLPLASRLDAEDSRDETEAVYELTTKWIYIITFPAFAIFLLFPGQILTFFWGSDYSQAGLSLSILSLGFFSSAAAGRNRETISAFGYTKYVMYSNILAFVVNVCMNFYLIPRYGHTGAAISSAVSFIALNLFVYIILEYKFQVSPISKYSKRTFSALPVVLLPLLMLTKNIIDPTGVIVILSIPFLGVISILVVIIAGGLQPEDGVVLSFVEEKLPIEIPYIRGWLK